MCRNGELELFATILIKHKTTVVNRPPESIPLSVPPLVKISDGDDNSLGDGRNKSTGPWVDIERLAIGGSREEI